jgi:hypothetical protein
LLNVNQKVPTYLGGSGVADEPFEIRFYLAAEASAEAARIRE